jgi:hypothetical protein
MKELRDVVAVALTLAGAEMLLGILELAGDGESVRFPSGIVQFPAE